MLKLDHFIGRSSSREEPSIGIVRARRLRRLESLRQHSAITPCECREFEKFPVGRKQFEAAVKDLPSLRHIVRPDVTGRKPLLRPIALADRHTLYKAKRTLA